MLSDPLGRISLTAIPLRIQFGIVAVAIAVAVAVVGIFLDSYIHATSRHALAQEHRFI